VFAGGWLSDMLLKRGRADGPMLAGLIGAIGLLLPAVAFTQVENLNASLALLVIAMFFASFPLPTSTAAMQMLAPNQMRAQISAVFLLVSNLIGLGVGTTLVALITDKVLVSPKAVGVSMSVVNLVATLLAIFLLWLGCAYFRRSVSNEEQHKTRVVENDPPKHDTSSPANIPTPHEIR
jgi:MFS family permease